MVSEITAKFCGHRYRGSGDMMVLVCLLISQEHVPGGLSNIWAGAT